MDRVEEKEIIEKALKYDVLVRTLISCTRLNYSKDDLFMDNENIILYMLRGFEEEKLDARFKKLKEEVND